MKLRAALASLLLASMVVLVGAPAAQADELPLCPTLEGWDGPTTNPLSNAGVQGGVLYCTYTPPAGSTLPGTTYASITASWRTPSDPSPSAAMLGGCGEAVGTSLADRVLSSAGTWAQIEYGIGGAGYAGGEAILLADHQRFLASVAVLMPAVEALAQSCTDEADPVEAPVAPTRRTAGVNRYETAVQISQVWNSTNIVYIATGQNFPDALGAGPAAAAGAAPILLVEQGSIPSSTAAELTRLQPGLIVLLGGTAAISDGVRSALGAYAMTVDRVAGLNRYATAAAVSAYAFPGTADVVYVASGRAFADPIIAGGAAALAGAPLLLVDGLGSLESEVATELARLQPSQIVVVGPASDLSGVLGSLASFAPLVQVNQSDIYARSAALWDTVSAPVGEVVLATSGAFADALAGTPYAALDPVSYLMLSRSDCVPAVVRAQMERLEPGRVLLLGGTAALSDAIDSQTSC